MWKNIEITSPDLMRETEECFYTRRKKSLLFFEKEKKNEREKLINVILDTRDDDLMNVLVRSFIKLCINWWHTKNDVFIPRINN